MRRIRTARALAGVVVVFGILASASDAWAGDASDEQGLAVIAEGSAMSSAWALAHAVYGDPTLRPPTLEEDQARALVGEHVASESSRRLRDLAETRAALQGEDAPSRSLLSALAASLHVKGLVVVEMPDGGKPIAHVFVTSTRAFDAVVYEPDPSAVVTWGTELPAANWTGALTALHRGFADPTMILPAIHPASPALALQHATLPIEAEKGGGTGKPFYTSPWFWGALAVAAFAGAAFYFVSLGSSDPTIQLQVPVPK